ncbi:MAG: DUF1499 domain-containing protein [Ketobacteraceae bacterium]|nr:DUF1499 domain-containing protein [Ketobacteraceae bacterium]
MSFIDRSQTYTKVLLAGLCLFLAACAGSPPSNLGVTNGRLAPCPGSPNCVSSFASDEDHAVAPWEYSGTPGAARSKLLRLLEETENATVITSDPDYIRAEFESALMGFVDDVEFLIEQQKVQVRSASRLGYSDLGANRSRINELKARFQPCCQ